MIVKTKKYKLTHNTYIKLAFKNIIREQWWVSLIVLAIASGTFFIPTFWFIISAIGGLLLYGLFWFIQFFGVTQVEQNHLIFEKLDYEVTSKQILIKITTKQGMPISWNQIKRVIHGKNYFLIVVSKAHIIYLPYKIFNSNHEIKFLETILKRKQLVK